MQLCTRGAFPTSSVHDPLIFGLSWLIDRANLTGAKLGINSADLARATLFGANLTGADLTGATLTGTELGINSADLTGVDWREDAAVPEGWRRSGDGGRLERAQGEPGGGAPTG